MTSELSILLGDMSLTAQPIALKGLEPAVDEETDRHHVTRYVAEISRILRSVCLNDDADIALRNSFLEEIFFSMRVSRWRLKVSHKDKRENFVQYFRRGVLGPDVENNYQ